LALLHIQMGITGGSSKITVPPSEITSLIAADTVLPCCHLYLLHPAALERRSLPSSTAVVVIGIYCGGVTISLAFITDTD